MSEITRSPVHMIWILGFSLSPSVVRYPPLGSDQLLLYSVGHMTRESRPFSLFTKFSSMVPTALPVWQGWFLHPKYRQRKQKSVTSKSYIFQTLPTGCHGLPDSTWCLVPDEWPIRNRLHFLLATFTSSCNCSASFFSGWADASWENCGKGRL